MKLLEALNILRKPCPPTALSLRIHLACGFTPLHLETFLAAYLRMAYPEHTVEVETGLYGSTYDSLAKLGESDAISIDALAVVLEWADFDPRLSIRQSAGWHPSCIADIAGSFAMRAELIGDALVTLSNRLPVIASLPSLPLPPVSHMPTYWAEASELRLRELVGQLAARIADSGVRVVNPQWLDSVSPPVARFSARSELLSGFPYDLTHASVLAESLVRLVARKQPRKGIITDLDGTLWHGILGEVGVQGVTWHLDARSHIHAVYQQMLSALADTGVLIAVASKNEADLVTECFRRDDLLLKVDRVYPFEVHWGPKSKSVERILQTWNIGAGDVVFIDDSAMELAEVQAAHPSMECLLFPTGDEQAVYNLILHLRDLFGKDRVDDEDRLRLDSIRRAAAAPVPQTAAHTNVEGFLATAEPLLAISRTKNPLPPRALELVNKTNQFNLNGRRYSDAEWRSFMARSDSFLVMTDYSDKYGPLGRIAVIAGRISDGHVTVDTWVMSCRAFSRRIEHFCMSYLFSKFECETVTLAFESTLRNAPMREFLAAMTGAGPIDNGNIVLHRSEFAARCPPLYHLIKDEDNG